MMRSYLSGRKLAELLDVKLSWIYDAAARGDIPGKVRLGRHLRFRRDAILAWLARLEDCRASDGWSDDRVLDRVGRLVAQAGGPDAGAHGVTRSMKKATTAPRRRGRRPTRRIPAQGAPP
jgi:excisionase family DNA binding protein